MESIKEHTKYYRKKIIELETEAKRTITFDTDKILSFDNLNDLGYYIKKLTLDKIKLCDEHIEYIKSLESNDI